MPTNANVFNSRVTSEALEAKYRQVFPAQGGAELPQDLFASGVIQPVVDFSSVAEGSVLPENLQTAFDFSTSRALANNASVTIANTPGFYRLLINLYFETRGAPSTIADIIIDTGLSNKVIYQFYEATANPQKQGVDSQYMTVFLRSGDSLVASTNTVEASLVVTSRQIATVNGTLVNPLGFTFS